MDSIAFRIGTIFCDFAFQIEAMGLFGNKRLNHRDTGYSVIIFALVMLAGGGVFFKVPNTGA